MGLQQSKPQTKNLNLNQNLNEKKKNNNPNTNSFYGGELTFNMNTNTIYQQFLVDEKEEGNFVKLIQSRQRLDHRNFVTVKGWWKKTVAGSEFTCRADKKVEVFVEYQFLAESLSKKLDKLAERSKVMSEMELRKIFLAVTSCLQYLQTMRTCHGDIKPQSIFFDQLGQVKLLDSFFMNGGRTSYEIVMQNPSSLSLLSPQQLQRICDKQFDDISLVHKQQIFSLGLTMYECMTFQPAMQCYDLQKLKLKKDYFKGKQQLMFQNGYSKRLIDTVLDLIMKPQKQRLEFRELSLILGANNNNNMAYNIRQ